MRSITAFLMIFSLVLSGCSSVTPMYPDPKTAQAAIEPGDQVYIVTKSGEDTGKWYKVTYVDDTSITSGDQVFAYSDIRKLEKLEKPDITNDESKTAMIIYLNIAIWVLIFPAIF